MEQRNLRVSNYFNKRFTGHQNSYRDPWYNMSVEETQDPVNNMFKTTKQYNGARVRFVKDDLKRDYISKVNF